MDLTFVALIASCSILIKFIFKSQEKVKAQGQVFGGINYSNTYKNFIMIVVSGIVPWIPLQVLMILSVAGVDINPGVMSWFAIFVLPINSLTNPIMHTLRSALGSKRK